MKLVSAIITTHGRLELLKKAIQSVKEQTYNDMEVIVVDDCSEDGTKEWFEYVNDPSIHYIYIPKEKSLGGNHARNVGIAEAKGEYIAFLDDDDTWEKNKIEEQVKILDTDPTIGLVYCGHTKQYENGTDIVYIPNNDFTGNLAQKVFCMVFCTTSMIMLRKDVLDKAGVFDEELKFWQEYDLIIRVCQYCKVGLVPKSLVNILHSSSDPSRLSAKIDGWLKAVDYVNEKYKDKIALLSDEQINARKLMIYNDAANRCAISGDMNRHKYFLKKAWEVDHSLKHYLKYKLNITNYQMDKLRSFVKAVK